MSNKNKKNCLIICIILFLVLLFNNFIDLSAASIEHNFSYTYQGQTYGSDISNDDAWDIAMKTQLDLGNITMNDVIEDYSVFGSRDIIEEEDEIQTYSWTPALSGTAQWQPDINSAYLPLQGVKVELYFHFSNYLPIKIDEIYTDDDGHFVFEDYENWYYIISGMGITIYNGIVQKFSVRIYPSGETFRVAKDWAASSLVETFDGLSAGILPNHFEYFISSTVRTYVWESSGSFGVIKIPYSTDNDTHKSFYISQALLMGQRFAMDVCGFELNEQVIALYPFKNFDSCFCWQNFMAIGINSLIDCFDQWSCIIHEYAHFLQWNLNINNIGLLNEYLYYTPDHESKNNHMAPVTNNGKGNKQYGAKLAWTEAWADVYSLITIDYYQYGYYQDNQYLGANGASILNVDEDLNEYNKFINNLNFYSLLDLPNMCDGQEDAIIMFMFELYKKEFYGLSGFLKTATLEETYIFSDYAQNLYNEYPTYINEIGALMGKYQLAPRNFKIKNMANLNYNISPEVSWRLNGSIDTPLDCVEFHFLDESGEIIYKTSKVQINERYSKTVTYTIPVNEWKQALNNLEENKVFLAVVGYNNDIPITGGYYSNIIEININFPVLFYSLNDECTSYILSNVWNSDKLYDLVIDETFNNKNITEISDNVLSNALNLHSVVIPQTVEYIGSYAFKNCNNLSNVIINKEDGITILGAGTFNNCSSLEEIIVPQNRIGDYKNALNWNDYKDIIVPNIDDYNVFELNCYTDFIKYINLSNNEKQIFKLNVTCSKMYNIILESDKLFEANLYDSSFNIITTSGSTIDIQLSEGNYYIDLMFFNAQLTHKIKIEIYNNYYQDISVGNANINNHIHLNEDTYTKMVKLNNVSEEGFYKIDLTGYDYNNDLIELTAGAITIYNSSNRSRIINMYSMIDEHTKAQNIDGANEMIVYLPVNQTFYISLSLPSNNFQSLYLSVALVGEENINLFNCSTDDEDLVFRLEGTSSGCNIQKINLKQAGTFEVIKQGFAEGLFVILKQLTIEDGNIVWSNNIIVDINDLQDNVFNLSEGIYYIGYANTNPNEISTFRMMRKVTHYGSNNLYHYSGTEVTVNGGSENTNTITQGFTRLMFLTSGESRLDYYWYTSNETVSRITEAGTLMALSVNNDTNIQIMAVNKLDHSKVYVKDYVIKKEIKAMDDAPLMYNYEIVMSSGIDNIVQIDLSTKNIPINWLQYYAWFSTSEYLSVDQFGRIYANEEAVGNVYSIVGQYKLNDRVMVHIYVTIV